MRRDPPPFPTALWEEFWWSELTLKPKCKQKFLSTHLLPHRSVASLWFQLITFINNNFTSLSSPRKIFSCLFQLAVSLPTQLSHWLPKVSYQLSLEFLWPLLTRSSLPARPPREPSNLSELKPSGPPGFLGFLWLSSATAHAVPPPCLNITRTILSKWIRAWWSPWLFCFLWRSLATGHKVQPPAWLPSYPSGFKPSCPPWVAFGHCSCSPASTPDYLENHLI
jgi:hypothetical protein